MRKLASIQTINSISPIQGRDRIVLATVNGWKVIVKKDEFQPGDKCVYIEIDSVLPPKPEFDFLKDKHYRIKTMKMAGVISQGICFPLSVLPGGNKEWKVGDDVTGVLGVTQYVPTMDDPAPKATPATKFRYPAFLMKRKFFRKWIGSKKDQRAFPDFIQKTDETRIQNMPFILKDKTPWIATEKIDGQSGTFVLVRRKSKFPFVKDKLEYIVCSSNVRLFQKDNSSYWKVSDKYRIRDALEKIIGDNEWVCLQGECIDTNVQGNKYKVKEPKFYAFNLITPTGRKNSLWAKAICAKYGIPFVPIIDTGYVLPDTVDEVLAYAHSQSQIGDTIREGIVFRSPDGRQSFKAVDPLFLLKYNE